MKTFLYAVFQWLGGQKIPGLWFAGGKSVPSLTLCIPAYDTMYPMYMVFPIKYLQFMPLSPLTVIVNIYLLFKIKF